MTIPEPDVVEGDDHKCRHMMWAMWEEDANGQDAHIGFWRTTDGRIALQAMESNKEIRGREMLRWLGRYGLPVHVVEVIPQAMGFWDRMRDEGLIEEWEAATGWPSALERLATPFPEALAVAA